MGKYFGTDGFRGEANCTLTADHAFKVGRFLGWYYSQLKLRAGLDEPARIIIGKDTRRSSYMLEYSLVGGLVAGFPLAMVAQNLTPICSTSPPPPPSPMWPAPTASTAAL